MSPAPTVELSHPDKVLWPQAGFTKADLAAYYAAVADRLLAHVRGRPLTLKRYNNGVDGEGFFQKNLPASAPAWLERHTTWTPSSNRDVTYLVVREAVDLQWLAQQNAVELHPWFATVDRPDRADVLTFDLDPSDPAQDVAGAARLLREVLDELGLEALVKTSGKRGLHVYVPVERRYDYEELRGFGLAVARACADRDPDALTVEMRKAERHGRLLLDWSRNGAAQTLVAAWSPRATATATVSMPLRWDEVDDDLDPGAFTLATAPARPDPWLASPLRPQRIEGPRRALERAGYPSVDRSPRARTGPAPGRSRSV